MRTKHLYIIVIIFFLLVQTEYYWGNNLGWFAIIWFFAMQALLVVFCGILVYQLFKLATERPFTGKRLLAIFLLSFVLLSTYLRPWGLIEFEKYETPPVLKAKAKGGGGCNNVLRLYNDSSFIDDSRCFGTERTRGKWRYSNDTIYFYEIRPGTLQETYFEFAIIKETGDNRHQYLRRYQDRNDPHGRRMNVLHNDIQLTQKAPTYE